MSEWFYIGLAYGVTYVTLGAFALHLRARYRAARSAADAAMKGGTR